MFEGARGSFHFLTKQKKQVVFICGSKRHTDTSSPLCGSRLKNCTHEYQSLHLHGKAEEFLFWLEHDVRYLRPRTCRRPWLRRRDAGGTEPCWASPRLASSGVASLFTSYTSWDGPSWLAQTMHFLAVRRNSAGREQSRLEWPHVNNLGWRRQRGLGRLWRTARRQ